MKHTIIAAAIALSAGISQADVRIVDGDTLEQGGITYRINGIDAPEVGQKCAKAGGGTWQCGREGMAALSMLVKGQEVTCDAISEDGYGRTIATCYAGDRDVGGFLVASGWAWAFVKYSDAYVDEEAIAQRAGVGIWQAETMPAWEYREQRWAIAVQEAPEGCPIKGNISENGRIYQLPWSPWYSRTRISEEKDERWFCSEAEAVAAGWRAPRWN